MMTRPESHLISLTDGAVKQLKRLLIEENIPTEHGLRIGVEEGCCSGLSYVMGFGEKSKREDTYEVNGVKIFMDKAHLLYLKGMEIDFTSGSENMGFSFNNPNAEDTCGCGTSFSVK